MNRIEELLTIFRSAVVNPEGTATAVGNEFKGVVGIMPVYAPEEIVHAAGYLPVGIWGGQKSVSKAHTYLPPFACSIMQSVMELQLEGVYNQLDAIIFSVPCDTLKCMSQKWKGQAPSIVFTHPQNRKLESANQYLEMEYRIVAEKLEQLLNVRITDEALQNSIKVYNENRQVMRLFTELVMDYPEIINPVNRHAVIKARYLMEKSTHTKLVRELIDLIRQNPPVPWKGKRIVLTGITAEPEALLNIFEENNLAVVADDLAQESRQFRHDIPEGENPYLRLARWWQEHDGCSLALNPQKPRGDMLIDMVKQACADGVIVCMMKFCDPEEFDYPVYYQQLEAAGIPSLMIEIDQQTTSFEQVRTRIQSFSEVLEG